MIRILALLLCLFAVNTINAQALSPKINPDKSVTFSIVAPNAQSVQLKGDFIANRKVQLPYGKFDAPGIISLTKNGDTWEYTTPSLEPELYLYNYIIDGINMCDPSNPYLIRDVSSIFSTFIISEEEGDRGWLYSVNDIPHGAVKHLWYPSASLGMERRMSVYTPAGYEDSNKHYPVLYLLHGAGGDEEAWLTLGRAAQILDNLIANAKAEPMIVVMTNGNAPLDAAPGKGKVGMFMPSMQQAAYKGNILGDGSFEMGFMDVIDYIDTHYRTKADKSSRAICGLSMGGFHSLHISHYFPDTFDYIGLFSAAINTPSQAPIFQNIDEQLERQFAANPKFYWIGIGSDDFLYKDNVAYRALLDSKGFPYEYYESEGGHVWRNWRIYLDIFAQRLFK